MKKLILYALSILFISTFVITSCKKYEDGPAFSLRTKKNRLTGDWTLESFSVNDVDHTTEMQTALGANFVWDIEKDGKYKQEGNFPDDGTWKLGEDKDDVYFQSSVAGSEEDAYRILRLKNKELWLKQTQANGDVHVIKLKQ